VKEWGRREGGRHAKRWWDRKNEKGKKALSARFFSFFVFALSQFSGPDYIGVWNRLYDL